MLKKTIMMISKKTSLTKIQCKKPTTKIKGKINQNN
jgi:hypothetical protein